MKHLLSVIFVGLSALPLAFAQTAPELFVFEAGTPIKASEVNANFQLLRDKIATAIGTGNVTLDDLEALAATVDDLQAAFEAGDLDGLSLEYEWDGSRLGVRQVGAADYTYVDLRGPAGPPGPAGADGVDGTDGVDGADGAAGRQGTPGADGKDGAPGADGVDGTPGADGADGEDGTDGRGIEYTWDGTQLGIRYEGETTYTFVELVGATGAQGAKGDPGATGATGAPGTPGSNGVDGTDGVDGSDGADGRTLLNGSGGPSTSLGADGDFYIDTTNWNIYGPKAAGGWGSASSLIGPQGTAGADGGGGASIGYVTDSTLVVTTAGEQVRTTAVGCPASDQLLVETTVAGSETDTIYGYIASIVPVSSYQSQVTINTFGISMSYQIHVRCLDTSP